MYLTVTVIAAVFTGLAALTYLSGHDYPKAQADFKQAVALDADYAEAVEGLKRMGGS